MAFSENMIPKIGLFICAAFLGGQGQEFASAAPTVSAPSAFPREFSPSYAIAFRKTPQLTAQRVLRAYDGLAKYGPVTYEAVHGHAMLQSFVEKDQGRGGIKCCLLYTSPSPRDRTRSRMPSSA